LNENIYEQNINHVQP